jgi:hypothetical protein
MPAPNLDPITQAMAAYFKFDEAKRGTTDPDTYKIAEGLGMLAQVSR